MTKEEIRTAMTSLIRQFGEDLRNYRDPLEGLNDLLRLNLKPETRVAVETLRGTLGHRIQHLRIARDALRDLFQTGYPDDIRSEGTDAILADLAEQARTIEAGSALFGSIQAVALNLVASPPEPK